MRKQHICIHDCKFTNNILYHQISTHTIQHRAIKNEIAGKEAQLNNKVFIDANEIKIGITDFFAGWIATMEFLGCSKDAQEKAQGIYNNVLSNYKLITEE